MATAGCSPRCPLATLLVPALLFAALLSAVAAVRGCLLDRPSGMLSRHCRPAVPSVLAVLSVLAVPTPPSEIIWARFSANFSSSLPPTSAITPRPNWAGRPVTFIVVWMRDLRTFPGRLERRPDGRRGGTGATGLLAGGVHDHHPGLGVTLGELRGPAVGQRHGTDLDFDASGDHLSVEFLDGGAGHAGRDPFHVKQHLPRAVRRDGNGKGVVELHAHQRVTLSGGIQSVNYARYRPASAKSGEP